MILYFAPWSPSCHKVLLVVHELGLVDQVELRQVDPFAHDPEFVALNPASRVPVMVDGQVVITDSAAIAYYLARQNKALIPDGVPAIMEMLSLLFFEASLVAPAVGGEGYFGELMRPGEPDQAFIARMQSRFPALVAVIDAKLADGRDWLAGSFSIADCILYVPFSKLAEMAELEIPPRVQAWVGRIASRPSTAAVFPA